MAAMAMGQRRRARETGARKQRTMAMRGQGDREPDKRQGEAGSRLS